MGSHDGKEVQGSVEAPEISAAQVLRVCQGLCITQKLVLTWTATGIVSAGNLPLPYALQILAFIDQGRGISKKGTRPLLLSCAKSFRKGKNEK